MAKTKVAHVRANASAPIDQEVADPFRDERLADFSGECHTMDGSGVSLVSDAYDLLAKATLAVDELRADEEIEHPDRAGASGTLDRLMLAIRLGRSYLHTALMCTRLRASVSRRGA